MIPVKYCITYEEQSMMDNAEVVLNKYSDFDFGQMHTHTFIEVCCVTEGSGWHILNDSIQRCSPGDLFIIDSGDSHVWIAENDEPMTIYNLIFRPGFFDPALRGKTSFADISGSFLMGPFDRSELYTSLSVHFSGGELARVLQLYDTMLEEYRLCEPGCIEFIRACATQLLLSIFRKRSLLDGRAEPQKSTQLSLAPVFDYINLHFAEEIPLRLLAALVYLSPSYFSRVFKLCTGRTVTEYIQRARIFNARAQLLNTGMPVAAIAEANGYSDPKHFTRIFRRITGMSPTQYRQSAKTDGRE